MKKLLVPLLGPPDDKASDTVPRVFELAAKSTCPSLLASVTTGWSRSNLLDQAQVVVGRRREAQEAAHLQHEARRRPG